MPSYKIGTGPRAESLPKDRYHGPDPTSYNPTDKFTKTMGPQIGFGTGLRDSIDNSKNGVKEPGPGAYNVPDKAFDSKYKFHMGIKTKDLGKDQTPGPADYEQSKNAVNKALPAYSMGVKPKWQDKNEVPGPG